MAPTSLMPNVAVNGFDDQTVRDIVFTSVGGRAVRVRLSNAFGTRPVRVGEVTVGAEQGGAQLAPGGARRALFHGHASVTLPVGGEVLSDLVPLPVRALEDLAVSIYLPAATGPATYHLQSQQRNYVAGGDQAGSSSAARYTTVAPSWYFLDRVDVLGPAHRGTVVALGDSITDGVGSSTDANARWPNDLARRLDTRFGGRTPGVADAGIGGNRVLNDSACYGVSALRRLHRDVLSQPGLRAILLFEGINDIGFSQEADTGCAVPSTDVSAAEIISGYKQIIAAAHRHHVKVFGCTLTPFRGFFFWSPAAEAKREAVNEWIRTSGAFDGVIDFAAAVQDPANPEYLNPAYNSGDGIHPNDAGYAAMAGAINLSTLLHV